MSDKVGEEVRAIVVKEVRSAILEATAPLQSHIEKLEDLNDELLAACKEAVAEFDTGWFAQGKSIIVAAIENMEGK